jgi:hypothetical protein
MKRMGMTVTAVAAVAALTALLPAMAAAAGPIRPDDRAVHGVGVTGRVSEIASSPTPTRPDDRGGLRGPAGTEAITPSSVSARPDDRGGLRGPGAFSTSSVRPDDRAIPRGPGTATSRVAVETSGRFDWGDASIGAFGGAGLALLLVGGIAFLVSRRAGPGIALR